MLRQSNEEKDEETISYPSFLSNIAKGFSVKQYKKGDLMFDIGDIGKEMFILVITKKITSNRLKERLVF